MTTDVSKTEPKGTPTPKRPPVKKNAAKAAAEDAAGVNPAMTFRGEEFTISRDVLLSQRVAMMLADPKLAFKLIPELLEQKDHLRFLDLCQRGESQDEISVEFFKALAGAGLGNS